MFNTFCDLIDYLESLDWQQPRASLGNLREMFSVIPNLNDLVRDYIRGLDSGVFMENIDKSHETNSHFKWFLFKQQFGKFSLWLHEFKNESQLRAGYANTIHTHRYWFLSYLLKGGYAHALYEHEQDSPPSLGSTRRLSRGDTSILSPNTFHRVADIDPGTVSLFLRTKAYADFSESVDPVTGERHRHIPFSARIKEFRNLI